MENSSQKPKYLFALLCLVSWGPKHLLSFIHVKLTALPWPITDENYHKLTSNRPQKQSLPHIKAAIKKAQIVAIKIGTWAWRSSLQWHAWITVMMATWHKHQMSEQMRFFPKKDKWVKIWVYFGVRVAAACFCTFFISNDLHQESKATSKWLTCEQEGFDQSTTTACDVPKMLLSISSAKKLLTPRGIERKCKCFLMDTEQSAVVWCLAVLMWNKLT